jgi:hypothetical protein
LVIVSGLSDSEDIEKAKVGEEDSKMIF